MSTINYIQNVMENMGFPNDGTFIPIANETNRKLMLIINELQSEKIDKQSQLQQESTRKDNLKKHTIMCEYNINHNLKLIDAHRSQLCNEHHMFKISENDENSLTKQCKDLQANINDINTHHDRVKNELNKIYVNINKSSEKIQWMKEALMEWTDAMERGDEANNLIVKYCKEDKKRAEALEGQRRIIQDNINKQKTMLIYSYKEQKTLEQILERTAQLYRQSHMERNQMVNTWKEAVTTMNSREKDIRNVENVFEMAKLQSKIKSQELKEQITFLEQQKQNNKEIEIAIDGLNDRSSRIRIGLTNLIDIVVLKSNELLTIKKLVQNTTNRLQQQRQKNRFANRTVEELTQQMANSLQLIDELQVKYENFIGKIFDANERLKSLDEIVEAEEKSINGISMETTRLSNALYRSQQMLNNWKNENKSLDMQITAIESSISNLKRGHTIQEKEILKQNETVYHIDYKVAEMERRIGKMKGGVSTTGSTSNPELESKLMELQRAMDEKRRLQMNVRAQIVRVEDDMRKMTAAIIMDTLELERLQSQLLDRQLCCEGAVKQLSNGMAMHQECLVEKSILNMRVHQMERMMERHTDKMYNLEKHKIDLELAISERIIDLDMQRDLLLVKRKHLIEELGQYKVDIGERSIKITALRARYDNAISLLGTNDDGTMVTATQIKIETAQEKQLLLKEGNELNEKVINAEKDIKAIENTLILLNYSNDKYKKKLTGCVQSEEDEHIRYTHLNKQYFKAIHELKECNCKILQRTQELEQLSEQYDRNEKDFELITRLRAENNDNLIRIHKEIHEQKSKLERAQRELHCARRAVKQIMNDANYLIIFEKDLQLKELEERNTVALQQLADMVDAVHGMAPIVTKNLYEKGVNMPSLSASTIGRQQHHQRPTQQISTHRSDDLSSTTRGAIASNYSLKFTPPGTLSHKSSSTSSSSSSSSSSSTTSRHSSLMSSTTRTTAVKKMDKNLFGNTSVISNNSSSRPSIITIDFPDEKQIISNRSK